MGYVVITFQVDPRGSLLCTQQVSTAGSVQLQYNVYMYSSVTHTHVYVHMHTIKMHSYTFMCQHTRM